MKIKNKFLLILNLITLVNFSFTTDTSLPDNEELERAQTLNIILEKELSSLDEVSSILQYIGQAINKGSIKIENLKETQKWIKLNQKYIKILINQYSFPLNEKELDFISYSTKTLIINLITAFKTNFTSLEEPVFTSTGNRSNLLNIDSIKEETENNYELIKEIHKQTQNLGLTTINLAARYLDKINNKYKITKGLEYTPYLLFGASALIYFTPTKYFNKDSYIGKIPGLTKVKDFLGTSKFTDKNEFADTKIEEEEDKKRTGKGKFHNLIEALSSKDFKGLGTLATIVAAMASKDAPWSKATNYIKDNIQNYWNELKGYESIDKSTYKIIEDITLDDEKLVGIESQVAELKDLVRYITNPEIYDRSNSSLEKGVLLAGPTRCGKTYAARALCGTLNKELSKNDDGTRFGFREIKWGEVRWNSEGIKTIIDQAKRNAPCVIFLDEIHNLPLQTKEGGETLTEFLTGMSGINSENDSRHQVILLAATNLPQMLDNALLQPGRFGTIIHFEKPNFKKRKKYFDIMFKNNSIDTTNIDIDSLAKLTYKCSYGDLEFIVKNARFKARTLAKGVSQQHLQKVIDKHVYRLKDEVEITGEEKKHISTIQAGHALGYLLLDPHEELMAITIRGKWKKITEARHWDAIQKERDAKVPAIRYGLTMTYNENELVSTKDNEEKEKLCKIKLAGPIAEKILLGTTGSAYNIKSKNKALKLVQDIVFDGFKKEDLPKEIYQKLNKDAYDLLKKYESETEELLIKNRDKLVKISDELNKRFTLSIGEIKKIIN